MEAIMRHERELRELYERSHSAQHAAEQRVFENEIRALSQKIDTLSLIRDEVQSERGRFVSREFYDEQHNYLRVDMDNRLKILETTKSNLEGRIWMMGAALSAIVVIVNVIMYFVNR